MTAISEALKPFSILRSSALTSGVVAPRRRSPSSVSSTWRMRPWVGWGWRSIRPSRSRGVFRPFALVHGRAVATWTIARHKVELEPFGRLARADREALEADASDAMRFLAD
ncbi:MAG TPA: hypothetical protein VKR21_13330 [Solirubrobacteraceae bacterium]|nr:hypothetical protein [Solirubrobacteraceae bacterium]